MTYPKHYQQDTVCNSMVLFWKLSSNGKLPQDIRLLILGTFFPFSHKLCMGSTRCSQWR